MNKITSIGLRASRFLSERYRQRERPGYFADLMLWGVVVVIATWPMVTLVHTMELTR